MEFLTVKRSHKESWIRGKIIAGMGYAVYTWPEWWVSYMDARLLHRLDIVRSDETG